MEPTMEHRGLICGVNKGEMIVGIVEEEFAVLEGPAAAAEFETLVE